MNHNQVVTDADVENSANVVAVGAIAGAAVCGLAALMGGRKSKVLMTTALSLVALAAALRKV